MRMCRSSFRGGNCRCAGIGTGKSSWSVTCRNSTLVIVTPNAFVSTATAYAALNAPPLTRNDPSLTTSEVGLYSFKFLRRSLLFRRSPANGLCTMILKE